MRLEVDPLKLRQMPSNGPWILWDHVPAQSEQARGLVALLEACPDRRCDCTRLGIQVAEVGAALASIEWIGSRVKLQPREEAPDVLDWLVARLDFQTGVIEPEKKGPGYETLLRRLALETDGELLDRAHERWLWLKGRPKRVDPEEGPWMGKVLDRLIGYCEVFPDARPDMYSKPEGTFLLDDMYCLAHDSGCSDTVVAFHPREAGDKRSGAVRYDRRRRAVNEVEEKGLRKDLVLALWEDFGRRYPAGVTLEERARLMIRASRKARRASSCVHPDHDSPPVTLPVAGPRAGPNEPCPCGSGKKYKKCCRP